MNKIIYTYSVVFYLMIVALASSFAGLAQKVALSKNKKNETKKYSSYFISLSFLILTLPVAFRYKTGADYISYVEIYNIVEKHGLSAANVLDIEIGFVALSYLCSVIFDNPQSLFIVIAFITNFLFYKAILYEANKINIGIAILVYGSGLYLIEFILIRNMLGIALVFFALRFLFEKNFIKYFVYVSIAVSFHYSLIIFFVVGIVLLERFKKQRTKLIILSILLIPILPTLFIISGDFFVYSFPGYSVYINSLENIQIGITAFYLFQAVPLLIALFFYNKLKMINPHLSLYFTLTTFSMILMLYSSSYSLINRFVYAFAPAQILVLASVPLLFNKFRNKNDKFIISIVYYIFILIYGFVLIIIFIKTENYYMLPYYNIFNK